MVMSHRSRRYRGHLPDHFTMMLDDDPARSGHTQRWTWSDEPAWSVTVCSDCDFTTGQQCERCAKVRAHHRQREEDEMNDLEWVDEPPEDMRRIGIQLEIIAALKARPGRWARVEADAKTGRAQLYRVKGCEAISRKRPEHRGSDRADIYARWPEVAS